MFFFLGVKKKVGVKAFFCRFFDFFTGKMRFSRVCFSVFFTFFTRVIGFHGQIFDFLHAQKNFFTPKKMRIFTGIFFFHGHFFRPKTAVQQPCKNQFAKRSELGSGVNWVVSGARICTKKWPCNSWEKKEREAPRKKKAALHLGKKDWRRAPRAREAGLPVELLRVKARKTPR